jgi:hypothetical protein
MPAFTPLASLPIADISVVDTVVLKSVSATSSANNLIIDVKVTVDDSTVINELLVGTVDVNLKIFVSSVSATAILGNARAKQTSTVIIDGVEGIGSVGSIEPNPSEDLGVNTLVGVSATSAVANVIVPITEQIDSISSTANAGNLVLDVKTPIQSVDTEGFINTVKENVKSYFVGVSAATATNTSKVNVSELISVNALNIIAGSTSVTGIKFDYQAVHPLYSRKRCVYVRRAA